MSHFHVLRKGIPGVSKPGGFPPFPGKVLIVSRTLSGTFLVAGSELMLI